jgi:hypothetical protein
LVQESQPLDDPVVEIDEFCFAEVVDINSHHDSPASNSLGRLITRASDAAQRPP